jgi:hypothetical protein
LIWTILPVFSAGVVPFSFLPSRTRRRIILGRAFLDLKLRCIFTLASYAREVLQALFASPWRTHCPTDRRRHLLRTGKAAQRVYGRSGGGSQFTLDAQVTLQHGNKSTCEPLWRPAMRGPTLCKFIIFARSRVDVRYAGSNGLSANASPLLSLTRSGPSDMPPFDHGIISLLDNSADFTGKLTSVETYRFRFIRTRLAWADAAKEIACVGPAGC